MKNDALFVGSGAMFFLGALLVPKGFDTISMIVYIIAYLIIGSGVIINAVKGIAKGNIFNENTLMMVASIGALFIGEYPEAVFVVLFYRVGVLFEGYAVEKSRKSISEVMNICPESANVLRDGAICEMDPEDVEIGDVIVVSPGERIPLDGTVVEGKSFLDTSALTGESVPRGVSVGDEALSGCINQNSAIKIRVEKTFENSTVTRILELVETAAARKSKSERFITKFARYYTPVVLLCALLLAVLPPILIDGASFEDYIYRALSFLVVSCPCALVISVPLAFFGGIGGAAKKGILIKGGNYLEALSSADTVVFDKTGTLTKGVFSVQSIKPVGISEDELITLASHCEGASTHPIAQSIRDAYGREIDFSRIAESEEIAGKGVRAVVDGRRISVGNSRLMEDLLIPCNIEDFGTSIHVAEGERYLGCITISDEVKPDAADAVSSLKSIGIKKISMLTGDVRKNAEEIAKRINIDHFKSDLLPSEKVENLEEIMKGSSGKTVYVGDGINDAPVLAGADIGIAMGALGSDSAIEASDVVIMTDELSKIAEAIRISKKTMKIARQNIIFSIGIKVAILILCSFNILGMGFAVFGDVGVMVLAVLNSFKTLKE